MGDKVRSEIQKPVKNPLLSGAGHGFPFETFQGSSLLVPVSQDSPSVLYDDVGEADKFLGQDSPGAENSSLDSLSQGIGSFSFDLDKSDDPEERARPEPQPQTFSFAAPSYSGIFGSFFGGKQESESAGQSKAADQQSISSISTSRSNSPYVHVPNVQSYSPALQVPTAPSQPVSERPQPTSNPLPPPNRGTVTTSKYRLGHQKRLAYAPVPGLTSTTHSVPSYIQSDASSGQTSAPPTSIFNPNLIPATQVASTPTPPPNYAPPPFAHQPVPPSASSLFNPVSTSSVPETVQANIENQFQPSAFFNQGSQNSVQNVFGNPPDASSSLTSAIFPPSQAAEQITTAFADINPPQSIVPSNLPASAPSPASAQAPAPPFAPPLASAQAPAPPPASAPASVPAQPSYFSPISNENLNPAQFNTPTSVFNPIPLHPSGSEPTMEPPIETRTSSPPIIPPSLNNLANLGQSGVIYRPVYHHWFIKKEDDSKEVWQPFSMTDSLALEQASNSVELTPNTVVATDGGRYDVNVVERRRIPVYWEEEPKEVRRCSWFFKNTTESRFRPYDENTAYVLEMEYKVAVTTNTWRKRIELNNGEYIVFYGANSMAHFQNASPSPDSWEAAPDLAQSSQTRPRIVKRGVLDDFEIDDGEPPKVDHLLFVVHGIGSVCDLKFRKIEEAVDSFRSKSHQLVKSHFRSSVEQGYINRIEILPVSWHSHLHGDATGVDKKLQTITLKSIPRLRHFTNDTLLDILFYTSPVYCQNMVQTVGLEINRLLEKFKSRNPEFSGGISLAGHSLGSLILFDMLYHQKPMTQVSDRSTEVPKERSLSPTEDRLAPTSEDQIKRRLSRNVSYVIGTAGTGQPFITYPQLNFQPVAFFAMGSPIGMFVTVRGIDSLGLDFRLPTCPGFFNIFHPFDPVAYRVEALINPDLADKRPVLIPHHKGRKRMHLELRETMARVGADLKQRLIDSMRSTWNAVYQLTTFGRADDELEQEVDQVIQKQLERQRTESVGTCNDYEDSEYDCGRLNQGRRVDYVLQEAPLESFSEYVSAITSHVMYWDSEDTVLLILKEIYSTMGVAPDNQQYGGYGLSDDFSPPSPSFQSQSWSFQRSNQSDQCNNNDSANIKPPPMSGFVPK